MLQNAASDLGLYCLTHFRHFFEALTGSKMDLFEFENIYHRMLRVPILRENYVFQKFTTILVTGVQGSSQAIEIKPHLKKKGFKEIFCHI